MMPEGLKKRSLIADYEICKQMSSISLTAGCLSTTRSESQQDSADILVYVAHVVDWGEPEQAPH